MGASIRGKTMVRGGILRKSTRADGKLGNAPNGGGEMDGIRKTGGAEMKDEPIS